METPTPAVVILNADRDRTDLPPKPPVAEVGTWTAVLWEGTPYPSQGPVYLESPLAGGGIGLILTLRYPALLYQTPYVGVDIPNADGIPVRTLIDARLVTPVPPPAPPLGPLMPVLSTLLPKPRPYHVEVTPDDGGPPRMFRIVAATPYHACKAGLAQAGVGSVPFKGVLNYGDGTGDVTYASPSTSGRIRICPDTPLLAVERATPS